MSNPEEKAKYDQNLNNEFISQEQFNEILDENINLKKELNYFNNLYNKNNYAKRQYSNMYENTTTNSNTANNYSKNINAQPNYTANHNNINKYNYKTDSNEKLKTLIAVILTFLIIFVIFNIPFIKEYLLDFLGSGYLIFFIAIIVFYIYFFRNKQ